MILTCGFHKNYNSFKTLKLSKPQICINLLVMECRCQLDSKFIANMVLSIMSVDVIMNIITIQATICKIV